MAQASPGGRYVRFLGVAVAIVALLGGVGFYPTRRLAGSNGLAGMSFGCLIGLLGAAAAGCVLVAVGAQTPEARMQRAFLAMLTRLAVVGALGLAAALSGEVARAPLLFWVAATYVALLPIEVKLAIAPE